MSVSTTYDPVVLEPASQALVEATAGPPFMHELSPAEARAVLDELQGAPIDKLPVNDRWSTVPADVGDVRVRIVRPPNAVGTLPVILYVHSGGWVLGNTDTHDRPRSCCPPQPGSASVGDDVFGDPRRVVSDAAQEVRLAGALEPQPEREQPRRRSHAFPVEQLAGGVEDWDVEPGIGALVAGRP